MSSLRVAAVAWKLRTVRGDGDFYGHFHDLVTVAHEEGAEVVVFPENQTLELLNLAPDLEARDVPKFLMQFSGELDTWIDRISRSSGMVIVGGTHFRETEEGIKSVCAVGNGGDGLILIEKNKLSAYERNFWGLAAGSGSGVLPDPRLAVNIGADVEYSLAGQALAEAGAVIQAVPSFTSEIRSFHRLRWIGRARASENFNYIVHASLIGDLGREPAPATYGTSAILTPSFEPFPETAMLGETEYGEEDVIVRTLDFDVLSEIRLRHGSPPWPGLLKVENEPS